LAKVANGTVTRYFGEGFEREGNLVNRKFIMAGSVRLAMRETAVSGGSAALPAVLPPLEPPIVLASAGGGVLLLQVRDGALGGWVSGGSLLLLAVVLVNESLHPCSGAPERAGTMRTHTDVVLPKPQRLLSALPLKCVWLGPQSRWLITPYRVSAPPREQGLIRRRNGLSPHTKTRWHDGEE